jgi:hypothetical protein
MTSSSRCWRAAALALPIVLTAVTLVSQDRPGRRTVGASVSGPVTTVSGNLITILNGTIAIDTTGATFHRRRGPASLAEVKPGTRIVAAITNPDAPVGATLQAVTVTILDFPDGVLSGPVQAVDLAQSTITLTGARIQVTTETAIDAGRSEPDKTLADLKPGDLVRAEVRTEDSGLVAVQIHILPPPPNATVTGTVKSMSATEWVITTADGSDVAVTINAQTKIQGSPQVGDMVHVRGMKDAAGNFIAFTIVPADPTRARVSLHGVVKSIGLESWVITTRDGDVTVIVNAQTRIDPSVQVGDTVEVRGSTDAAGNIVALAIMKSRQR